MKRILHSDRLAESTQDGPILPRQDFQHLYKSIIDQVRSAKMAGYCRRSFLRVNFRNLCNFGEMHFLESARLSMNKKKYSKIAPE